MNKILIIINLIIISIALKAAPIPMLSQADEASRKALELAQDNPEAAATQWRLVCDLYEQAKKNPAISNGELYYNLGNVYKLMGNKEFAKDSFEQTLKLKPDYVTAYNNLGNILDSMGDYQYALTVYQKGLKIDFNNWKIHYNIAITFEKIGNVGG